MARFALCSSIGLSTPTPYSRLGQPAVFRRGRYGANFQIHLFAPSACTRVPSSAMFPLTDWQLASYVLELNYRPRKCLNYRTPAEVFNERTVALTM